MAPEVVVPANFGKHHLKSRSHSNLELLCDEGEIKRANSMILSLNSPVIDDLISRLDITSLDVQDFGAPAVGCFVESMYSGELEKCDKRNFRDLNKMGHVFNVSWFTERCLEYFTEHVDMLTGRCYEDVLFVVEEARFVEDSQKKKNFTSLVENKLNTMRSRKSIFLKQYAKDLDSISMSQLKIVIKLAGSDVGILVSVLVTHHQKVGAAILSETSRYLFKNIDFEKSFSNSRYFGITTKLFEILSENCNEEFKTALEWISRFAKRSSIGQNNSTVHQYPISVDLPLKDFLDLDWVSMVEFLSLSDKVCNLYQLFDAIFLWLHMDINDTTSSFSVPRLQFTDNHVKDIVDIKQDRCWKRISSKYLEDITDAKNVCTDMLIKSFLDSGELTCGDDGILFSSEDEYSIDRIFTEDLKIKLVSNNKVSDCSEESRCAVMLQTSRANGNDCTNPFSLTVVHDVGEGCDNVHYHNPSSTQTVSLMMRVISENVTRTFPIPFNCLPVRFGIADKFWHWGFLSFQRHKKYIAVAKDSCKCGYGNETNAKVVFSAVITD